MPIFLGENPTVETVADHMEHFLALGGENGLGLGSDFDGGTLVFDGVEQVPALWKAMERRGHPETLVEKVAFGNLARFMEQLRR